MVRDVRNESVSQNVVDFSTRQRRQPSVSGSAWEMWGFCGAVERLHEHDECDEAATLIPPNAGGNPAVRFDLSKEL